MSNRTRVISKEVLGPGHEEGSTEYLVTELSYHMGGINYATYKAEPRGYYVHVRPETHKPFDGADVVSFLVFSGYKALVKPADRFSAKVLAELPPYPIKGSLEELTAKVRAKHAEDRRAAEERRAGHARASAAVQAAIKASQRPLSGYDASRPPLGNEEVNALAAAADANPADVG